LAFFTCFGCLVVFVSPARRPRFVVPDFAPGGLAF